MHTYHALEMNSGKAFQFAKPIKDKVDALEAIHGLNRTYRNWRCTLVRPTEEELVGEQR